MKSIAFAIIFSTYSYALIPSLYNSLDSDTKIFVIGIWSLAGLGFIVSMAIEK